MTISVNVAIKVLRQYSYFSLLLAMFALQPGVVQANESAAKKVRPKICLVLSGGGARGAAHVGVIKVLEEQRVPIDCVVGTSMGALVGAAYASGMTLPEMQTVTSSITSELLFKDKPPRQERTMRNKQDDYSILFSPEMGVSDGEVKVGKGIVSGVQLESVLRQLSKAKGYYDFDELPMQYRAVATDLVTGKPVVFAEGELAMVMRASMSVPGAVAPAEFDGMMLVDGMLTSNLPVQTARALGADIIIAVNVGTPLLKREELGGILGVTGQMLSILTEQNVQESLATLTPSDILISPDLQEYSTGDFDSLPQIVPLGEVAARKEVSRLAALSLSPAEYASLRQQQTLPAVQHARKVDEIRVDKLARTTPDYVRSFMETQTGEPIDQKTLDEDMRRIYGSGDYEHTSYRFLDEEGKHILSVEAVEKAWGPDYLRLGLGLSSDFSGDAYFDLLGSYRQTWLNSLGAEWRTDVQFGRTDRIYSEFYQPLDRDNFFFVAPYLELMRHTTDLYQDDDRVATYDTRSSLAGFDVGSQFYRYGEMRLGMVFGEQNPELDTGPQRLSPGDESVPVGALVARLNFDRLDSAHFPREGWRAGAKLFDASDSLGAEETYSKWNLHGLKAISLNEHTFSFALKAGGALGDDSLPRYDLFQWGGFMKQSGYASGQLLGEELIYGRVAYYQRIMRGTFLDGAYGGFAFEMSEMDKPLVPGNDDGWLKSGLLFIGSDTPLGPAYVGVGQAADGNNAVYFYLGNPF